MITTENKACVKIPKQTRQTGLNGFNNHTESVAENLKMPSFFVHSTHTPHTHTHSVYSVGGNSKIDIMNEFG